MLKLAALKLTRIGGVGVAVAGPPPPPEGGEVGGGEVGGGRVGGGEVGGRKVGEGSAVGNKVAEGKGLAVGRGVAGMGVAVKRATGEATGVAAAEVPCSIAGDEATSGVIVASPGTTVVLPSVGSEAPAEPACNVGVRVGVKVGVGVKRGVTII